MSLTESFAMLPAASVSGFYFSHPESQYFGIGKIGNDQVDDYAEHRKMELARSGEVVVGTYKHVIASVAKQSMFLKLDCHALRARNDR